MTGKRTGEGAGEDGEPDQHAERLDAFAGPGRRLSVQPQEERLQKSGAAVRRLRQMSEHEHDERGRDHESATDHQRPRGFMDQQAR